MKVPMPPLVYVRIENQNTDSAFLNVQTSLDGFDWGESEERIGIFELKEVKTYKSEVVECPTPRKKKKSKKR